MKNVLSGVILLMSLGLAACGSLTVQGDVLPAAEATRRQSATLSGGELGTTDKLSAGELTPTLVLTSQATAAPLTPEPTAVSTGMSVAGWGGFVVSLPDGSEFDDKVQLLLDERSELGIKGADETTEARIVSLRDTQKETHFWGQLICDSGDYNNCQLVVERMVVFGVDAPPPGERVDGWVGTIVNNPPGSQFDDYFMLLGDYPLHYRYGIESAFSSADGELGLADEIEALGDSGKVIRIWGELVCGAIDVGGCQIAVSKMEVDGTTHEITPVTLMPD